MGSRVLCCAMLCDARRKEDGGRGPGAGVTRVYVPSYLPYLPRYIRTYINECECE